MPSKTYKNTPKKVEVEKPKEVEVETPVEVQVETPQEVVVESKKVEVGMSFENAKITEILWETSVEASVALDNGTTTVINKRI